MAAVQTVLGPMPPENLGRVLMHEHLLFELPGWELGPLVRWDWAASLDRAVERLVRAREAGMGTFVDATAIGVCRDSLYLAAAARRSGVPSVAGTGWWLVQGITGHFAALEVDDLARIMVHELIDGIADTGIRAGIIKVATSEHAVHPVEEKVLRAAARAQRRTGCCITTHTSAATMGMDQMDIFAEEGADLSRVIIGHSDDRDDLDYHRALLRRGVTVEFDHIGSGFSITDETRAKMVATLVGEGWAGRLTLSQDTVARDGRGRAARGRRVSWPCRSRQLWRFSRSITWEG